jgi:translation elongation factor EF-4
VVCLVAVVDGALRAGDKLAAASSGQEYEALEVSCCMSFNKLQHHISDLLLVVCIAHSMQCTYTLLMYYC